MSKIWEVPKWEVENWGGGIKIIPIKKKKKKYWHFIYSWSSPNYCYNFDKSNDIILIVCIVNLFSILSFSEQFSPCFA